MKLLHTTIGTGILAGTLLLGGLAFAAETDKSGEAKNTKPYTLKTCIVSGEKLNGGMGEPYVFVHEGQQIKLCCKGCLKDFNKEPAKYLKKLEAGAKESNQSQSSAAAQSHSGHGH